MTGVSHDWCKPRLRLFHSVVVVELSEGEEEGEEGGSLKAQRERLEAEKQALLQNKELIVEVCILASSPAPTSK